MASETKSDLVDALSSHSTKAELVELLGSRLKKDEISKLLDDESDGTKDELLRKLGLRKKDELVQAVESRLTKDEIEQAIAAREDSDEAENEDEDQDEPDADEPEEPEASDDDSDEPDDSDETDEPDDDESDRDEPTASEREEAERRDRHVDDTELDWSAELEWAPPPRPTPAPVRFVGAAPFMPGARVRVDLSGLPTLGIFLGKGASAAGTITAVNAQERTVRVYLDACFGGEKEINVPPERVLLDQ
jgi:hypothetical protein